MALFTLNEQNLELGVRVGILENYKPNKEIRKVYRELEKVKSGFKKKINKITGKDSTEEINSVLESSEEKRKEFQVYLKGEFNEQMSEILREVEKLNETLCPGYVEYKEKSKKKE